MNDAEIISELSDKFKSFIGFWNSGYAVLTPEMYCLECDSNPKNVPPSRDSIYPLTELIQHIKSNHLFISSIQ